MRLYVGNEILRLKNWYRWQKIWKFQNWFERRKRNWNCEISLIDSSEQQKRTWVQGLCEWLWPKIWIWGCMPKLFGTVL